MKSSSSELEQLAQRTIQESIVLQRTLLADDELAPLLAQVGKAIAGALGRGGKILLFGNGGSAADAQHIAAEFVGRYRLERPSLPAIALTTDTSALTAIGNDYAFEDVFSRPLEALGSKGDVAMGFSTSGRSPNVLKAMAAARNKRLVTVALTGQNGKALAQQVDYCFCVPSMDTPRVQEAHALIGHILCDMVETLLAARLRNAQKDQKHQRATPPRPSR